MLHGHRHTFIEPEDVRMSEEDEKEREANQFASQTLIPESQWEGFLEKHPSTLTSVSSFASDQGISPGIVVGRLQYEGKWPRTQGNGLKRRFSLVDDE